MSKTIIGCDPDSDGAPFAVYKKGKLQYLKTVKFTELDDFFSNLSAEIDEAELHIEDLNSISASSFNHRARQPPAVKYKISESVGQCKHAQKVIEQFAESHGIKVFRHKVSSQWKKNKAAFEKYTGWECRSNEDTRSAAYFGYIGLKNNKQTKVKK